MSRNSVLAAAVEKGRRPGARLGGAARALALELVAEARVEWGHVTELVAAAFRRERALGSAERRLVAETVYGMIRQHRRLGAIVDGLVARRRARAVSPMVRAQVELCVYELREGGAPPAAIAGELERLLAFAPDPGRLAAEDAGLAGLSGIEREAVRLSYPTWMLARFCADHGEEPGLALAAAMNRRAPLCVRANTVKVSREELARRLTAEGAPCEPTRLATSGLVLAERINAFALPAFQGGLFEVMDEGSQLCAEAVAPPPGGAVADACAGAGGKTLALAALLGGKGRVLALDANARKLEELRRRARRAGLSNVVARALDGGRLPDEARPGRWDRVLVDAPCSGLGVLRRHPEARWRLAEKDADAFPGRQLALLLAYAPLVAGGGRLVYATCTVTRAENDGVVERFLAERPDFHLAPLKEFWGKERAATAGDGTFLRVLPHRHDTDGFFAAILRRTGSA